MKMVKMYAGLCNHGLCDAHTVQGCDVSCCENHMRLLYSQAKTILLTDDTIAGLIRHWSSNLTTAGGTHATKTMHVMKVGPKTWTGFDYRGRPITLTHLDGYVKGPDDEDWTLVNDIDRDVSNF